MTTTPKKGPLKDGQVSPDGWVVAKKFTGATETRDSITMPSPSRPPIAPVEMPDLRLKLLTGWATGPWQAAARVQAQRMNAAPVSEEGFGRYVDWEIDALNKAELWWVGPDMVDLVVATMPKVPGDVQPPHLEIPSRFGLVVLAKPWLGTDSYTGTSNVQVDAVAWGPQDVQGQFCLSISMYRCLDWSGGVRASEMQLAEALGLLDNATKNVVADPQTGKLAMMLTGKTWMPIGRSEWPMANRLDEPINLEPRGEMVTPVALPKYVRGDDDEAFEASNKEDRRFLASLFTLLAAKSIAETTEQPVGRPARKRQARAGVDLPEHNVKCVYLRRPEKAHGEYTEHDGHHVQWSHRWVVSAHMRNQPYGPGRSARKLILIPAHVKGPDDKPVVVKETVKVWIR